MKLNENILAGLGSQFDWANTINGGITETSVDIFQNEQGYEVEFFNTAFGQSNYHIEISPEAVSVFATLSPILTANQTDKKSPIVPAFIRQFPIPNTVDIEKIEAIFEDQVLKIIAPFKKNIGLSPKKLDIRGLD